MLYRYRTGRPEEALFGYRQSRIAGHSARDVSYCELTSEDISVLCMYKVKTISTPESNSSIERRLAPRFIAPMHCDGFQTRSW